MRFECILIIANYSKSKYTQKKTYALETNAFTSQLCWILYELK